MVWSHSDVQRNGTDLDTERPWVLAALIQWRCSQHRDLDNNRYNDYPHDSGNTAMSRLCHDDDCLRRHLLLGPGSYLWQRCSEVATSRQSLCDGH
jgi:hypothetical protein